MKTTLLALSLCAFAPAAHATETKKPAAKESGKMKMDLNLPSFGAVPKGDDIAQPKADNKAIESTTTASNATYTVLRVLHGKQFTRSASGATPSGSIEPISLSGTPPSTPKFTTVVRVKSPQRVNSSIDVVILDPRGDTAMTASGEVNFRGTKQDEVDYTVDWDPTPQRAGGQFQVMVRIGGQVMGTWPLKVEDAAFKK